MATLLLFSDAITNTYKDTSESLKEIKLNDSRKVRKTLTQMMTGWKAIFIRLQNPGEI